MRVVLYLGGQLVQDFFLLGEVFIDFEGCSEVLMYFIFFLQPNVYWSCDHSFIDIHCTYLLIYIYDDVCCYSPISPCVVSFLSLYTCFFMYAIFYFCFTLRCLDEFCLKCFRKTSCQNLLCHELSSCKVFQEFVLGIDFIVFNK